MLECIGGDQTVKFLECMPPKSTCILYGSLNEVGLDGFDPFIMKGKEFKLEGFILGEWIKQKGMLRIVPVIRKVTNLMNDKTL